MTTGREAIEAKALISSLSEFSSRAGHDLVGPVNQAGSLLALFIGRHRNQIDSEADRLLEYLQRAAARMEETIAGVAEYMAIASAQLNLGPVDLNASLASSRASLEKKIAGTGAIIEADSLPQTVADAAQAAALFEILIGNSIKFRKPDIAPRIRISCERTGNVPAIAIRDNGIGIDPECSDSVFQPFRRLHGREYQGTGLGLAVAKLIAERHGGTIGVVRAPEKGLDGACVRFTLWPS